MTVWIYPSPREVAAGIVTCWAGVPGLIWYVTRWPETWRSEPASKLGMRDPSWATCVETHRQLEAMREHQGRVELGVTVGLAVVVLVAFLVVAFWWRFAR